MVKTLLKTKDTLRNIAKVAPPAKNTNASQDLPTPIRSGRVANRKGSCRPSP